MKTYIVTYKSKIEKEEIALVEVAKDFTEISKKAIKRVRNTKYEIKSIKEA